LLDAQRLILKELLIFNKVVLFILIYLLVATNYQKMRGKSNLLNYFGSNKAEKLDPAGQQTESYV